MIRKLFRNNLINKYCTNYYLLNKSKNSICFHQIKCTFSSQENIKPNHILNLEKVQKHLIKIENDYNNLLLENRVKYYKGDIHLLENQAELIKNRKDLYEIIEGFEKMKGKRSSIFFSFFYNDIDTRGSCTKKVQPLLSAVDPCIMKIQRLDKHEYIYIFDIYIASSRGQPFCFSL